MAFVCDLKSKPEDEDLEDGEIEDDDEDTPMEAPPVIPEGPALPAITPIAPTVIPTADSLHKSSSDKEKSSSKESKESRKERKSSRHEKKHMTEAEKSVLYLHKMERLEREKREKYRRDQGHGRRPRGGSISPPVIETPTAIQHTDHAPNNTNSDDAADEDFATSLQRVLQSVLKKDKSAQAQAAVAGVNQLQQQQQAQGSVSNMCAGANTATCASVDAGTTGDVEGVGESERGEGVGVEEEEISSKRAARRRKRERKKAVKRARLEAAFTAALTSDGPQMDVNDSNDSTNINGESPNQTNNNKMDAADDNIIPSEYSSSDEDNRHERRGRGERRCNRKLKRRYRSAERDCGMGGGGTPTKVKKGETKLGLCLSYIQGKCMNRDCPYSHEYSPHMKMELCKFYLMECCAKGDKCYYLHKEFPCKYYHTGLPCIDGEKCKFNHGKPLSDSFRSILCKHIETAPKEILGDFPRFNREDAMNMIAITQKKLEEKYSKKEENKDNEKDDKRDAKRNRPSRWQDPEKKMEQSGSVVNLSFLHDKDQDMRFASNNGDIDMRTLPTSNPSSIPLPATINTSTPPPNLHLLSNHKQPSPNAPIATTGNTNLPNVNAVMNNDPQAILQQLGVSNPAAAALLLAGAQSGVAGAAAVAALLQSVGRNQQVQLLAGAPIVAGGGVKASSQPQPQTQVPITMQIPPPQLNPNAILFSTPPPSLLNTPPPGIRPSILPQAPTLNQKPPHSNNHNLTLHKPTTNKSSSSKKQQHQTEMTSIVTSTPPPLITVDQVVKKEKGIKGEMKAMGIKMEVENAKQEMTGDDGESLDIERYKREAGIGRVKVESKVKEEMMEVKVEPEDDEEERSLQIDCDPPLADLFSKPKQEETDLDNQLKAELPNLPRAQMDLFLRIQSQQAKSTSIEQISTTNTPTDSKVDIPSSSNKDNTPASAALDINNESTIDWYSDDDDDDDDENKLTIGEDTDPYDDIITKTVDQVPKSNSLSIKKAEKVEKPEMAEIELLLPPVVEVVPRAEQIVEKLGDLSKIDISAEVTKLLTSISAGPKKGGEEKSSSSSSKSPSHSYTPPTDPRTSSSNKSPRSTDARPSDPRTSSHSSSSSDARHHRHHHREHSSTSSTPPHSAQSMSPTTNTTSSTTGRSDPRQRRRSSAESSDGGRSSGSDSRGRAPVPSIYDQATASFRMSNKDLDLRLGGSGANSGEGEGPLRAKLADVDLRSVSQGGRPDIDLRATMPQQLSLPLQFKAAMASYTPATEIDATYHASYVWRIYEVDVPRPDYSGLRLTEAEARSTGDPRLEKIFRLASGTTGDVKPDESKDKTEFTIDESPASPIREQPVAKPSTPRVDPRRRKPIEEAPPAASSNSDPSQLTYAQQLALLQTSSFYQNLTSNQKLNLNHELSQRMQSQPNHPHLQLAHQQPSNDPVMAAVLQSLGLTGGNMGMAQQQHQQQQMMIQLQQVGALGLIQQMQQQHGGGGGPRGGMDGRMPPNNQQGLLGAAPGVPHDFNNPVQQPQQFHSGPPSNMHQNNFNNSPNNYNNSPNDNQYDQYDHNDDNDNSYGNNNCYNNNSQQMQQQNNNMMMMGGGRNHRGGGGGGGGGGNFRDNRNNNRRGGGGPQGQNRNFGGNRNNRNNFRRNRNNGGGGGPNRGGMID